MAENLTRRSFLARTGQAAAAVGLGLAAPARQSFAQPGGRVIGANDRIRMGVIGCGGQGRSNMRSFMRRSDLDIVACCDVDREHLDATLADVERRTGRKPAGEKDFRKVLEMRDVDAVLISTPDHWHALPAILACEAGKDVYLEKPISHDIYEGRAIVNAAKKYGRVVQIGTWQRSTQHFVDAVDYVRSGKLGKISVCRAWILGRGGVGHQQPQTPPPQLDWEMWLGPAPMTEYRSNRCHYNFRWFYDYAAGMAGDWGVHMMDIVLLAMDAWHPTKVSSVGGKFISGPEDDRDTPDTQMAIYQFPDFVMNWEVHVGNPGLDGGRDHGTEFIGSEGVLLVDRGGWKITDKKGQPVEKPASATQVNNHWDNFIDCMRSRVKPRSDIETMHFTTTACHLANLAYRTGREIDWDGAREVVTNDKDLMRDQSYRRAYRKPWSLPMHKVET
jgi:predicted dehydrogenase